MSASRMTDEERRRAKAALRSAEAPDVSDPENPEWSETDFARAVPAEDLPAEILSEFPNTRRRGRPKVEAPKEHVSIRLSQEVLTHFRAKGRGWQTAIDRALRMVVEAEQRMGGVAVVGVSVQGPGGVLRTDTGFFAPTYDVTEFTKGPPLFTSESPGRLGFWPGDDQVLVQSGDSGRARRRVVARALKDRAKPR